MSSTSKATVAGVLDIAAGLCAIIGAIPLTALALIGSSALGMVPDLPAREMALLPMALFLPLAVLTFVSGAVAVAGGIAALQRRHWLLSVIGAVAALLCFLPLGIAAIVLTVLAEPEFAGRSPTP